MRDKAQLKDSLAERKMTSYEWYIVQTWWAQRLMRDEAARVEFVEVLSTQDPD